MLVLGVCVLTGCGHIDPAVEQAAVLTATSPGGFVLDDRALNETLTGDLTLSDRDITAAVCHSLLGGAVDWAVGPEAVVSSQRELVRVGELVTSGAVDPQLAGRIEGVLLRRPDLASASSALATEAGVSTVADVDNYLSLRAEDPSAEATGRFVAYVQNQTLTTQRLVIVDRAALSSLDIGKLPAGYGTADYEVAGDMTVRTMTDDECADLLRRPRPG